MDECGLECAPRGGNGGDGVVVRGGSGGQAGTRNLAGEANGGGSAGDGGGAGSDADCPEDFYAVDGMPCPSEGKVCRHYECNFEIATLACEDGVWDLDEVADGGCEDDSACPFDLLEGAGTYCSEEGKTCVDWESDTCEFGVFLRCDDQTWTLPHVSSEDGCLPECPSFPDDSGGLFIGMPCPLEGKLCDTCDITHQESYFSLCDGGVWVELADQSCPVGGAGAGGGGGAGG